MMMKRVHTLMLQRQQSHYPLWRYFSSIKMIPRLTVGAIGKNIDAKNQIFSIQLIEDDKYFELYCHLDNSTWHAKWMIYPYNISSFVISSFRARPNKLLFKLREKQQDKELQASIPIDVNAWDENSLVSFIHNLDGLRIPVMQKILVRNKINQLFGGHA